MNRLLLAAASLAVFSSGTAQALTATDSMEVSATAVASCTVSAGALAFGNYTGAADVDATATISVSCGAVEPSNDVYVTFGLGANASDSQRQMANGTNRLDYNLYSDSGRQTALDATGQLPIALSLGSGTYGGSETVYGRIPASQNVQAGSYTDTIVVTLNY